MSFIGKFFIIIFGFLASFFLFLNLFRLNNDTGAYIGLSDVYLYFKDNDVDIWNSFADMVSYVNDTLTEFKEAFIDVDNFTNIWNDGFDWYEVFTVVWEGFKYLFNITLNLSKMIFLPLGIAYYLLQYSVGVTVWFFQFLSTMVAMLN